jgi:hypothetical protein
MTLVGRKPFNPSTGKIRLAHLFGRRLAILTLAGAAAVSFPINGRCEPGGSLEGSWSGGGWVSIGGGEKERARCHVHYSLQHGGSQYSVSATCATDGGKVSQTAQVHKSGDNSYKGSFYNSEYDVSGAIRVIVHGNKQTVTLTSEAAVAQLSLTR